jgi:hypothetical protein
MTTALELIASSMRLANIIGEGQTPSGDQATQGLETLNDILSGWNTDSLVLFATSNDQVTFIPGQSVYTAGPGGDFVIDRPGQINSMYCVYSGVSFPITEVNQDEYNLITNKTQSQQLPRFFLYVNEFPFGKLTFWPTPSEALQLFISVDRVISDLTLATVLSFPPGYRKALRAALACELCPEYGREPSPSLVEMAKTSKADIKRANHTATVAEYDSALTGPPTGLAAFLSGY